MIHPAITINLRNRENSEMSILRMKYLVALIGITAALSVIFLGIFGCSSNGSTPVDGEPVPFRADGVISSGEYDHQQKYGDYELFWRSNNTTISIGMKAKATGFVAVAVQPGTLMKDADIILGMVEDGKTEIHDMYSTGDFGPHPEDITLGGTNDISVFGGTEEGGYTIIEFQRNLITNDEYDHPITSGVTKIIWAYGQSDQVQIQHSTRGYGEIIID
jgi:hypothetical protein